MAITSDNFIERALLKRKLNAWRVISVIVILLFALSFVERGKAIIGSNNYIARITISDIITDNKKLYKLIDKIKDDDNAKAVILEMDTPGGVAVAGEAIFQKIKDLREKKPVVVSMRSVCASAGYMISLAADRIFAMNGTITGSIGVILQTAEISKLAEKIGVTPITIKSGELKGNPSIAEPITEKSRAVLQTMIDEMHLSFVKMVAENRNIAIEKVMKIADGRVYSANSAVKLGLIDEIGDEQDAIKWLQKNKNIDKDLLVKDAKLKKDFNESLSEITGMLGIPDFGNSSLSNGMMLIWHPNL